ncbi:TPA: hypothetical protein ACJHMI_005458 [Bacillus cereus]
MNLTEVLKRFEQKRNQELYTVRGNIIPIGDGNIRLEFCSDAYALIRENDIDPCLIFPLIEGEDPSGRNSKYLLRLAKGTSVELHVKNLVHTFDLADSTHPFYVDEEKEEIVYLDTQVQRDCECKKWVTLVDIYCCGGGFFHSGYGFVGCSDEWCEDRCCE